VRPALDDGVRGHQMAKAALEMPVWALAAEKSGVSLSVLIGGVRDAVPTGISLGIQPDGKALVERVAASIDAGYRRIKLKIKPGADIDIVAAVREVLGPAAPLMVDANTAYTLQDLPTLRRLDGFGLMMIEQPLHWEDLAGHATLQEAIRTPICLDESITGVERAEAMIRLGSARVLNLKPGRVGGLAAAIAIHDLCGRHAVPVWCGGMLETGIGRAYNVALASLPNFTLPGDLSPSSRYWKRDIVSPEWTMNSEGMVRVPKERPGIGVDVDEEWLEKLTVSREVLE
jgi:o-succinylbenzoate synthase